jgi:eukaryotic-like serine/threonine-protein kinase
MDELTIFTRALDITSPWDRAAFLQEACGADAQLLARVEALLHSHQAAGRFLEGNPLANTPATIDRPPLERPGMTIGPYKLLEQIGEGGFGVVYMAEQLAPVRRRVALKVIKPGMDTRWVIARFEVERQALAVMDHPNIAKVLDAGATESGRPYFVMELVRGTPITQYCDENSLSIRERLALFATVCQTIQHAHTKGIIHRDIKPTNVLATLREGQPVVKVIDFGVAKAIGQQLTDKTLFTEFPQMIGTPLYMSPEQAELTSTDIDTRSDVYSLGVLLYELLTGTTPVSKQQFEQAAFDEIRRIIREEEPLRPSTRISTAEAARIIAAHRHTEPSNLARQVRGELDWIVMKALEKDRSRRYETPSSLGRDVEHYLHDEPVLACPPSRSYRLRKLVWRNKGTFAAASAVALLLVLTVITLALSNSWIRQEQARTNQEKVRAENAQQLAEGRADEIRQGLARLKTANLLLDRGRWYAWERSWDDACEAFSQAIQLRSDHVSLWVDRAELYTRLGLWDLAAADYAREMELREPDITLRWYQHALLRRAIGDEDGCRQTARAMRKRFMGTLHVKFAEETVRSSLLVPDPDADLAQLIEVCQVAAPSLAYSMPYVLGTAHYRAGQYDEAIERLKEAPVVAPSHWAIGRIGYPVLAMAQHRLGHESEARQALDEAARVLDQWTEERYTGGDAAWPAVWWDYLECQLNFREAKLLIDGAPPPDDPRLHVLRARALAGLDSVGQAAAEFDIALTLSPNDKQIRMEAHRNQGRCCVDRRQWHDAADEFRKAAEIRPDDASLWRSRAVAHFADGDVEAYRQTCMAMLDRFAQTEDRLTAGNVMTACVLRDNAIPDMARLLALIRLSDQLWHWGDTVRGAALYRAGRYQECVQCFEMAAKTYRPRAWEWCFLAMAHYRLGDTDEARRCQSEARCWIEGANQHEGDDPSATQPVWGGWNEPVVYPLLVREAEALLKQES